MNAAALAGLAMLAPFAGRLTDFRDTKHFAAHGAAAARSAFDNLALGASQIGDLIGRENGSVEDRVHIVSCRRFPINQTLTVNDLNSCGSILLQKERGMALRIELKPGERILIGESVLINSDQRATFLVEGNAPILREKDIITTEQADTPAKRIYLAVQLMYTSRDPSLHHDVYFALMRDILQAAPSTLSYVESINNRILTGDLYKALKEARNLVQYEQELLQNA
jgi:flagellar protein FlbT